MNDNDNEPPAVTSVNESGSSPYLLICEHASNYLPARYENLGLTDKDVSSHIAWDIGAALLARALSELLNAPLFLSGYSRLLIDCNRPPGVPSSIPARSEDIEVPGNLGLTPAEVAFRERMFFAPFHERIARFLDNRMAAGRRTSILGIHSFTPIYRGVPRPWHVGVLHGRASAFASPLIEGLEWDPTLVVGNNEPYRIDPQEDYTVPVHGDSRGIPAVLVEVRNDLLSGTGDAQEWATRIAGALREASRTHVKKERQ